MELNLNTRFGRMEIAAEQVSPPARDQFFQTRRAWGGPIRIADYELAGLKMQGDEKAEVYVKIAWYRVAEGDLRTSTLKQKWQAFKGDWKLVEEARLDGDVGLLGEAVPDPMPSFPRRQQFPTIRLGQGPAPGEGETLPVTSEPLPSQAAPSQAAPTPRAP